MINEDAYQLNSEIQAFIATRKSLILATRGMDTQNDSEISYAPFLKQAHCFYIFVSHLAPHTAHLMQLNDCDLFLVEDEASAKNIFARVRLSLRSSVRSIAREEEQWEDVISKLEERFGNTVNLLKGLDDFCLFELTPIQGRFIKGFGAAYEVDNTLQCVNQLSN